LFPTFGEEVPINHQNGSLTYFRNIKEALEIGLNEGIVPVRYTPYLIRAPPRIKGLLEHDDPQTRG